MFYTYIIQSEKSGRYYIGHTSDLDQRLANHNDGRVKSTSKRGPWRVRYFEEYETKIQANQRELEIKKKKSRKYLEFLIHNKRE